MGANERKSAMGHFQYKASNYNHLVWGPRILPLKLLYFCLETTFKNNFGSWALLNYSTSQVQKLLNVRHA